MANATGMSRSNYAYYETDFKGAALPVGMIEKIAAVLIGQGGEDGEPITEYEVTALAGAVQVSSVESDLALVPVTTLMERLRELDSEMILRFSEYLLESENVPDTLRDTARKSRRLRQVITQRLQLAS